MDHVGYNQSSQRRLRPVRGKGRSHLPVPYNPNIDSLQARGRTPGDRGGVMSRELPPRPNLEHLKKQAKELLRELRQRQPDTLLSDAQHTLARDYGYSSWPALHAHVSSVIDANT